MRKFKILFLALWMFISSAARAGDTPSRPQEEADEQAVGVQARRIGLAEDQVPPPATAEGQQPAEEAADELGRLKRCWVEESHWLQALEAQRQVVGQKLEAARERQVQIAKELKALHKDHGSNPEQLQASILEIIAKQRAITQEALELISENMRLEALSAAAFARFAELERAVHQAQAAMLEARNPGAVPEDELGEGVDFQANDEGAQSFFDAMRTQAQEHDIRVADMCNAVDQEFRGLVSLDYKPVLESLRQGLDPLALGLDPFLRYLEQEFAHDHRLISVLGGRSPLEFISVPLDRLHDVIEEGAIYISEITDFLTAFKEIQQQQQRAEKAGKPMLSPLRVCLDTNLVAYNFIEALPMNEVVATRWAALEADLTSSFKTLFAPQALGLHGVSMDSLKETLTKYGPEEPILRQRLMWLWDKAVTVEKKKELLWALAASSDRCGDGQDKTLFALEVKSLGATGQGMTLETQVSRFIHNQKLAFIDSLVAVPEVNKQVGAAADMAEALESLFTEYKLEGTGLLQQRMRLPLSLVGPFREIKYPGLGGIDKKEAFQPANVVQYLFQGAEALGLRWALPGSFELQGIVHLKALTLESLVEDMHLAFGTGNAFGQLDEYCQGHSSLKPYHEQAFINGDENRFFAPNSAGDTMSSHKPKLFRFILKELGYAVGLDEEFRGLAEDAAQLRKSFEALSD